MRGKATDAVGVRERSLRRLLLGWHRDIVRRAQWGQMPVTAEFLLKGAAIALEQRGLLLRDVFDGATGRSARAAKRDCIVHQSLQLIIKGAGVAALWPLGPRSPRRTRAVQA
jgi:hypothetical protein